MSDRRREQAAMARLPAYTLAGLYESGVLLAEDEGALEEIRSMRLAVGHMVNPSHGWMSPKRDGGGVTPTPRPLGWPGPWRRYCGWHRRWANRWALPPSPCDPWGFSWAAVVIELICEPATFADMARRLGISPAALVDGFVTVVRDYGRPDAHGVTHMSRPPVLASKPRDSARRTLNDRRYPAPYGQKSKKPTKNAVL
jgi:hypothetical protein